MVFPQTPLPVRVYIAPGGDPAADPGDWSFEEVTGDVRAREGIEVTAGRGDEANRVNAGRCSLTLDNRSGAYSPRNPAGPWFGLLGKNTPLQVRLDRGLDVFDRVRASGWGTADSGQNWSHTGTATWTANGSVGIETLAAANTANFAILNEAGGHDIDILYSAAMPVVATGGPMAVAALGRYVDADNMYRIFTEFHPAGVLKIAIAESVDGSFDYIGILTLAITYSAAQIIWTRVQADGPTIRARVWADGSPEPTTWDLTVDGASALYGIDTGLYVWRQVTNTNVGSLALHVQHFETQSIMHTGTVAEWPIRWDQSGNDCTTMVESAGVLRRLQQGRSVLRSPLYRQLTRYSPAGYWPLEDGSDATAASSAAVNGQAATVTDVTFGADIAVAGAESAVKLNSVDSALRGVATRSTGTGFAAMFLLKLSAVPAATTTFIEWSGSGTVKTWRIKGNATNITTEGLSATGAVLTTVSNAYGPAPTLWTAYQVEAVQNGANVDWSMLLHEVGTSTFFTQNGSTAGTVGTITGFLIPGSTGMIDAHVSHVYAGADTLPFVTPAFALLASGYAGELASDRVQRLCDEENVRVYVEPGTSMAMGPQRIGTFLQLLYACEDADLGVIYEIGTALAYRPHGARLNASTVVDLDFAAGDVAAPPEPTDDDQRVRNDITARRDNGGEYRAADEAHIARAGRYDEGVELNVETDDQLPVLASWLLHLGTWDELRWPSIAINLARNDQHIDAWHSMMHPGSRLTISSPPSQVDGDELDLIVEGYTQRFGMYSWDVDLSCSPARPWDVAVVDDSSARIDTDGSTLASSATTSATSLSVTSTDVNRWTTDGAECPFDINVGGERCTVTAVSGASNPQTFTVTRAVNGIVLAHASGTDVRLWQASYVSIS